MKMQHGNINRTLLYLQRMETRAETEAERDIVRRAIQLLDAFSRTPEGFAFDQRRLPAGTRGELRLIESFKEMKKYL